MFTNFSYELKSLLNEAKKYMVTYRHSYIGTEHFLLSILNTKNDIRILLNDFGLTYEKFKNKVIEKMGVGKEINKLFVFTPLFKKILEESILISNERKDELVKTEIVLQALIDEGEGVAFRIICELGVDIDKLYERINISTREKNTSFFNDIGIDLTEKAKKGLIDPVIGRDKEIENVIGILLRKNKRNPLLIGPAGVGKTAIVEALACLIVKGNVPNNLLNKKIISISIASLVAGTKYRGEFEEKIINIVSELERNDDYILFIDEIHTLMGAGGAEGAIDASNILKPALSRDKITIIGATTIDEYHKHIEDDKAFSRRFQTVIINEPKEKELFLILEKVKQSYEKYHNVIINKSIIKYIIHISDKYIKNRKEPDRSIDLIDEISSMISTKLDSKELKERKLKEKLYRYIDLKNDLIKNNKFEEAIKYRKKEREIESIINNRGLRENNIIVMKTMKKEDVDKYICKKYGVELYDGKVHNSVLLKQKESLIKKCENYCKDIEIIFGKLKELFNPKTNVTKPFSFIFYGNDTNAKTTIINTLSSIFNNNIIEVDLNEFSDEQSISKMIGSPPGYIGYNNKQNIFERIKEQPLHLIVLNNLEKANKKIKDLIDEILDKGFFTDSCNYRIDFLNSLIIINKDNEISSMIGFNNKNINYDKLNMKNIDIINFNKIKVSVI